MRSREEIEKSIAARYGRMRIEFELLLDIRELLKDIKRELRPKLLGED